MDTTGTMSQDHRTETCTAFLGERIVAEGDVVGVIDTLTKQLDRNALSRVQIFSNEDSRQIELDLSLAPQALVEHWRDRMAACTAAEVAPSIPPSPKKRGRPKLGVVSKEVTLMPRHWTWLAEQPGGASVALRRLVEDARRAGAEKDRVRRRQEACYRFMHAMAGDLPNFEEATRALYAREGALFRTEIAAWPRDIREHTAELATDVFIQGRG